MDTRHGFGATSRWAVVTLWLLAVSGPVAAQQPAPTRIEFDVESNSVLTRDTVEIRATLFVAGLPAPHQALAGQFLTLRVEAQGGPATERLRLATDSNGEAVFALPAGTDPGVYKVVVSYAGGSFAPSSSLHEYISANAMAGYLVVIVGNDGSPAAASRYNKSARSVISTAISRQFTPESILYFTNGQTSPTRDGVIPRAATVAGIETGLTDELASLARQAPGPVHVLLVGVGTPGGDFLLNEGERITPEMLDGWISAVEAVSPARAVAGVFANHAGAFVPHLSTLGRVVISSTRADEVALQGLEGLDGVRPGSCLLEAYAQALQIGNNVKVAFMDAAALCGALARADDSVLRAEHQHTDNAIQHALLDDNGDASGTQGKLLNRAYLLPSNPAREGESAERRFFGIGPNLASPVVAVEPTLFLESSRAVADLEIEVDPGLDCPEAMVEIRAPGTVLSVADGARAQHAPPYSSIRMTRRGNVFLARDVSFKTGGGRSDVFYTVQDCASGRDKATELAHVFVDVPGNTAPGKFAIEVPAPGSTVNSGTPLEWQAAQDPSGDAVFYSLRLSRQRDGDCLIDDDGLLRDPETVLASGGRPFIYGIDRRLLQDGGAYCAQVVAFDAFGARTPSRNGGSAFGNFAIDNHVPQALYVWGFVFGTPSGRPGSFPQSLDRALATAWNEEDEVEVESGPTDFSGHYKLVGVPLTGEVVASRCGYLDGVQNAAVEAAGVGVAHFSLAPVPGLDVDTDSDGEVDACDNCIAHHNGNQRDTDGDGFGNRCDADLNNSGLVNVLDLGMFKSVFLSNDADADLNGDGIVNVIDLGMFKALFLLPPGPSGLSD